MATKEQRIQTLARFQEEIASLGDGEFVYRGQSDKEWNVTSTAYRRLSKNGEKTFLLNEFIKYHENLISDARNYKKISKDKTDLDLLAELQHYGAATSLIDFSHSAVIALWFACQDSKTDGEVFCLNVIKPSPDTFFKIMSEDKKEPIGKILTLYLKDDKDKETEKPHKSETIKTAIWQPSLRNNRIIKQDSVFIFNQSGEIKNEDFDKILTIQKSKKTEILKYLEKLTGITETRIFPDFYGFALSNAPKKAYKVSIEPEIKAETADKIFKRALNHHQKGKFKEAIENYNQVIKLKPNNADAYNNRGAAKVNLEQPEEAIKDFDHAIIQSNKKHAIAYGNRGDVKRKLGRLEEAMEDYSQVIDLKPNDANTYNDMGVVMASLKQFEKAIEYYKQAIRLNPNDANAYYNKGLAKFNLKRFREAIKDYNRTIELNPNNVAAYYNRGLAEVYLKQLKKAIKSFDQAIELYPNNATFYYSKGLANANLKQYKEAIKDYNKAIELKPDYTDAYNNRGAAKASLGQPEEAIKDYNRAIELKPDNTNAYYNRGFEKFNLKQFEWAIKDYNQAIKLKPNYANAYYARGGAKAGLWRFKEAIKDFEQAKAIYINQGDIAQAKECENEINKLKNK